MKKTIALGLSILAAAAIPAAGQHTKNFVHDNTSITPSPPCLQAPSAIRLLPWQSREIHSALAMKPVIQSPVMGAPVTEFPFTADFNDGLGDFTAVDANNDGTTWAASSGWVRTSAKNGEGDDWLMSPAMTLESGCKYQLTFTLKAWSSTYNEKIEVRYGSGNGVADMTVSILSPTDVKDYTNSTTAEQAVALEFTPAASGTYNIGIRAFGGTQFGTGDARFYTYVDNFKLDKLAMPVAPAAVENLVVTPGAEGALTATVSFSAPRKAVDGTALGSIDKIELSRGDVVIKRFEDIAPGSPLRYDDALTASGSCEYTAIAYNEAGKGTPATASAFIGTDIPGMVLASAYDDSSSLKATWEKVTSGKNNGYVNSDAISYSIARYIEPENWWEDATIDVLGETSPGATSYDFAIDPDEGEQDFAEYIIAARNTEGLGDYNYISPAAMKVTGKPYPLPFDETFANAAMQPRFWIMQLDDPYTSNSFYISPKDSYDKENASGCISWTPIYDDENASLITGKIKLKDTTNPTLFSAVKGNNGTTAKVNINAQLADGLIVNLASVDLATEANGEWKLVRIPLDKLSNSRYIHIIYAISGNKNDGRILLDDIHIIDLVDNNAAVTASHPDKVVAGEKATINAIVTNRGDKQLTSFVLKASVGEEVIYNETVDCSLATFESMSLDIDYAPTVFVTEGTLPVSVTVTAAGDNNPQDNTVTSEINILAAPDFAVTNLKATHGDNAVILSWDAASNIRQELTESFETYAHGSTSGWGAWQSVDRDGGLAGGINGYPLPHDDETYSFMVLDPAQVKLGTDPSFAPHSGDKYIIASYVYADDDYVDCDDWLISPALPGTAQSISFWVNSYDGDETYEVLCSSTGTDPADFVKIKEGSVGTEWTNVTADLPEGTRYFAIRRTTDGYTAFFMMLDDIAYSTTIDVDHYNIYLDGMLTGTTKDSMYSVPCSDTANHQYSVTTVASDGRESAPASVTTALSGIEDILLIGTRYDVYNLQGMEIMRGATSLKGLLPGIYIINGHKVIIR